MFSADGHAWTDPQKVLAEGDWLWRVTWHDGAAFGVSYTIAAATATTSAKWAVTLYRSSDGIDWKSVTAFDISDEPNETTLRFDGAGNMLALVRREQGNGWFGIRAAVQGMEMASTQLQAGRSRFPHPA